MLYEVITGVQIGEFPVELIQGQKELGGYLLPVVDVVLYVLLRFYAQFPVGETVEVIDHLAFHFPVNAFLQSYNFV